MRLDRPFLQLPVRYCSDTLAAEIGNLPSSAWTPHPQGFPGNDAVALISPGGEAGDDFIGSMAATSHLMACPYIVGLMADLGAVWGRSRLMGLGPGAEVPLHVDVHYYWRTHLRIHIPIITNPGVRFTCGSETVHMAAGECWVFNSFEPHRVENAGADKRTHLVIDTVGGERLWDLVEAASAGAEAPAKTWLPAAAPATVEQLAFEEVNLPRIMSPWEIRCHVDYIAEHAIPHPALAPVLKRIDKFIAAWHAAWGRFGTSDEGVPSYRALIARTKSDLDALGAATILLRNGQGLAYTLEALVFWNAVAQNPDRLSSATDATALGSSRQRPGSLENASYRERFDRPIFIVSTPRSGSTLLFETLSQAPNIYTPGGESHNLIEGITPFSVPAKGWHSNRLTKEDATPAQAEQLARSFYRYLADREHLPPSGKVRMLEKTPKNAVRVPFFDAVWPDSNFVFLYRDPRQTMSSMLEAWLSGGFRTYPGLPGWEGHPWSLLLVPGWQRLSGLPLPEVIAHQWATTIDILVDDLSSLSEGRVRAVVYDDLVEDPQGTMERLTRSLGLDWDRHLCSQLPPSKTTVSRPGRDKWRRIEHVIASIMPIVEDADAKARAFVERIRV